MDSLPAAPNYFENVQSSDSLASMSSGVPEMKEHELKILESDHYGDNGPLAKRSRVEDNVSMDEEEEEDMDEQDKHMDLDDSVGSPNLRMSAGGTVGKDKWDERLHDLITFKNKYGHCRVPQVNSPNLFSDPIVAHKLASFSLCCHFFLLSNRFGKKIRSWASGWQAYVT